MKQAFHGHIACQGKHYVLLCVHVCVHVQYPKEDYAAEMPLLRALQREQVVANLRSNSHAMSK